MVGSAVSTIPKARERMQNITDPEGDASADE